MGPVKAALESLTRYLAVELAQDNIQVNAISAGPIYGELLSKYPDAERLIPYWESLSAGHRLGEQSDVANFATYLLSEGGNKITGSVLLVDSGGSQRI
ncbi:MAG: SDR family oxidoreductase [Chloroflexi bacterium]|nr:MAG: SDR family oxidoreductase [Chloroflexota bacterium]